MQEYKLSKEWIKKNGDKIKEAYSAASARGYDVSSNADVLKLLQIIDPLNANESNAAAFSKILQLFAMGIKKRYESKQKKKANTVH